VWAFSQIFLWENGNIDIGVNHLRALIRVADKYKSSLLLRKLPCNSVELWKKMLSLESEDREIVHSFMKRFCRRMFVDHFWLAPSLMRRDFLAAHIEVHAHKAPIIGTAFSPDGNHFVSASVDGTVYIWDAWQGRKHAQLFVDRDHCRAMPVVSIAWSPNTVGGSYIASGCKDGTISVYGWSSGSISKTPAKAVEAHKGKVWAIEFSSNGQLLASGSSDNKIRVWLVKPATDSEEHPSLVSPAPRDPSLDSTDPLLQHERPIVNLRFLFREREVHMYRLASLSDDGMIILWKISRAGVINSNEILNPAETVIEPHRYQQHFTTLDSFPSALYSNSPHAESFTGFHRIISSPFRSAHRDDESTFWDIKRPNPTSHSQPETTSPQRLEPIPQSFQSFAVFSTDGRYVLDANFDRVYDRTLHIDFWQAEPEAESEAPRTRKLSKIPLVQSVDLDMGGTGLAVATFSPNRRQLVTVARNSKADAGILRIWFLNWWSYDDASPTTTTAGPTPATV
jgi:WD40 repeat protein